MFSVVGSNPNQNEGSESQAGGSALEKISAMIPPPPKPGADTSKTDEADWD